MTTLRTATRGALLLLLALPCLPARAQKTDYLSEEEVKQVRETQEPNQRIQLFLTFAEDRLRRFEELAAQSPQQEEPDTDNLRDRLNDFISAVDDTADALDLSLARGGVDLRKTRKILNEQVPKLLERVEAIQKSYAELAEGVLQFDLEDALLATQDLSELVAKVPDEPIPPKQPGVVAADADEQPAPAGGRPTLKRPKDREPKPPR